MNWRATESSQLCHDTDLILTMNLSASQHSPLIYQKEVLPSTSQHPYQTPTTSHKKQAIIKTRKETTAKGVFLTKDNGVQEKSQATQCEATDVMAPCSFYVDQLKHSTLSSPPLTSLQTVPSEATAVLLLLCTRLSKCKTCPVFSCASCSSLKWYSQQHIKPWCLSRIY